MLDVAADDRVQTFDAMMRAHGMPEVARRTFALHLGRVLEGASGLVTRAEIGPVLSLPDADDSAFAAHAASGRQALDRVVVLKLNGGLGTSMGLERAKSLLPVRDGLSFLDLIARQVLHLRRTAGAGAPLLLMNSFRTAEDSERALARYPDLPVDELPLGFPQHQAPKVTASSLTPASSPQEPELAWCPPGHGDLYPALWSSGVLFRLLDSGFQYAFVSNADNLGAVLEPTLLGFMVDRGLDFVMEVADRTLADRKGGHLCRLCDGRLALRESAQCPADEEDEFQDVEKYRYFNTNSIWLRLGAVAEILDHHDGVLPLPTIVNRKTLDPRNPESPPVLQLETAMGAAISTFDQAAAVRVPRRRFSPVKTTSDLLAVRSDAYRLRDDFRLELDPSRETPPTVRLDDRYFKLVDDFDRRFGHGTPSLIDCDELTVEGDVWFGSDVEIRGRVKISATGRAVVPSGTVVDEDLNL